MSQKLQPVRGTHDLLPEEFEKFYQIIARARELSSLYGFVEMATPIFEQTEVFARSLGDTSDIVHKEMFTFETKGNERVTLRPEFTAAIVRAFISNGMQQRLPLRLFSAGPVFRYERPQKGRQRQFHQVNFEWLGDNSPAADIELIILAGHLLFSLANQKACTLLINTLGDKESRGRYREALVTYLNPYAGELSEDSQRRLITNPLRILDSKSPQDQKILEDAPKITECLSDHAKERFDKIYCSLKQKGMPFLQDVKHSPSLVRGLDYYTDIVFEFVDDSGSLGTQNTILAGGRYDGLIEQMGGNPTPAIGFAAGIERLLLLIEGSQGVGFIESKDIKIIILSLHDAPLRAVYIAAVLRSRLDILKGALNIKKKITVETLWPGNLKKLLERSAQRGASHVVILGPDEDTRSACKLRIMETREQQEIPISDLADDDKLIKLLNIVP